MKTLFNKLIVLFFAFILISPALYARQKVTKVTLPDWFFLNEVTDSLYIGISDTGLTPQKAEENAIAKALFLYTLASESDQVKSVKSDKRDGENYSSEEHVEISDTNIGYQVAKRALLKSGETVVAINVTSGNGSVIITRDIDISGDNSISKMEIAYKSPTTEIQTKWEINSNNKPENASHRWSYTEQGYLDAFALNGIPEDYDDYVYSNCTTEIETTIGEVWKTMLASLRIEFSEEHITFTTDNYEQKDGTYIEQSENTSIGKYPMAQKVLSIAVLPQHELVSTTSRTKNSKIQHLAITFKSSPTSAQQLEKDPNIPLADFLKKSIEKDITTWQVKGEFETTAAWRTRVNETTRNEKIAELTETYKGEYYKKHISMELFCFLMQKLALQTYDADNQSFLINGETSGGFVLPVDLEHAQQFKADWNSIAQSADPTFEVGGDGLYLSTVQFTHNDIVYTSHLDAPAQYSQAEIDYNFDPIEIDENPQDFDKPAVDISRKKAYADAQHSDVNINIPETSVKSNNTFVLIIANENYDSEKRVDFALNDGRTFREYCLKTLGIPKTNIHLVEDATFGNMTSEIEWLRSVLVQYGERAKAIFYYAGHGIPNEATGSSYLLPTDCANSNFNVAYSLDKLYKELGMAGSTSLTYFIDACFSGADRGGEMMASSRGVAIKAKQGALYGNSILFSAASSNQTASAYKEKGHGLFTYFLLKKLQESKGKVGYKELGDYIKLKVGDISTVQQKAQTPNVVAAPQLGKQWEEWDIVD